MKKYRVNFATTKWLSVYVEAEDEETAAEQDEYRLIDNYAEDMGKRPDLYGPAVEEIEG